MGVAAADAVIAVMQVQVLIRHVTLVALLNDGALQCQLDAGVAARGVDRGIDRYGPVALVVPEIPLAAQILPAPFLHPAGFALVEDDVAHVHLQRRPGNRGPEVVSHVLPVGSLVSGRGAQESRFRRGCVSVGPVRDRAGFAAAVRDQLSSPGVVAAEEHVVSRLKRPRIDASQRRPGGCRRLPVILVRSLVRHVVRRPKADAGRQQRRREGQKCSQ